MNNCVLCGRALSSSGDFGDTCSYCRLAQENAVLEAGTQLKTIKEVTPRTITNIIGEAIKEIKDLFGVDVTEVRVGHYTHADAMGRTIRLGVSEVKVEVAL
jgi:hypothetical protein